MLRALRAPSPKQIDDPTLRQGRGKTARQMLAALIETAKHLFHVSSTTKPARKLTRCHSKGCQQQQPRRDEPSIMKDETAEINSNGASTTTSPLPADSYRVASASQLNGRYVEHVLRSERTQPRQPERTHSLRNRRTSTAQSNGALIRSKSTQILTASPGLSETWDEAESPKPYSPQLSTVTEQTEPEATRPLSEVLSVGEARIGRMIRATDYETTIFRFGAKAIQLIDELGPLLEVYGRREMAIQLSEAFNLNAPEYFRPHVTKLFTRCCVCDINIQGDPIKLASRGFELGSAGLEIGACRYLNLAAQSPGQENSRLTLRTDYDVIAKHTKYIVHFAMPLCDEKLKKHYMLIAQVDITNPLRRLALQESAGAFSNSSPYSSQSRAVSTQMRRFLSFIYWLGTFHSNSLCFTKPPTAPTHSSTNDQSSQQEWQLRFASAHIYTDLPNMVVHVGPSSANSAQDMQHMALMMDREGAFVQNVVWGRSTSDDKDASTSYLQYCVPVTDGRSEGREEKWWVGWLVEKWIPRFWGTGVGAALAGDEVVEYPFLV